MIFIISAVPVVPEPCSPTLAATDMDIEISSLSLPPFPSPPPNTSLLNELTFPPPPPLNESTNEIGSIVRTEDLNSIPVPNSRDESGENRMVNESVGSQINENIMRSQNTIESVGVNNSFHDLVFPNKVQRVRGRPRGTNTTSVIGLTKRVKAFEKKTRLDKEAVLLQKLVKTPVRNRKRVFDCDDIKDISEVASGIIDQDIDVDLVHKSLTDSARAKVARVISVKRDIGEYHCPVCKEICRDDPGDAGSESIFCNSCREWLHIRPCSGERRAPKSKNWFCAGCRK